MGLVRRPSHCPHAGFLSPPALFCPTYFPSRLGRRSKGRYFLGFAFLGSLFFYARFAVKNRFRFLSSPFFCGVGHGARYINGTGFFLFLGFSELPVTSFQ